MTTGAVTADGRVRVLADGNEMPMLGLGVWQVPDGPECVNAARWALELGYRHLDTAQAYRNEESVGRALRESGVPREQVFITTKFYPGGEDLAAEAARSLQGGKSVRADGSTRRRMTLPGMSRPRSIAPARVGVVLAAGPETRDGYQPRDLGSQR